MKADIMENINKSYKNQVKTASYNHNDKYKSDHSTYFFANASNISEKVKTLVILSFLVENTRLL